MREARQRRVDGRQAAEDQRRQADGGDLAGAHHDRQLLDVVDVGVERQAVAREQQAAADAEAEPEHQAEEPDVEPLGEEDAQDGAVARAHRLEDGHLARLLGRPA